MEIKLTTVSSIKTEIKTAKNSNIQAVEVLHIEVDPESLGCTEKMSCSVSEVGESKNLEDIK